MKVTNVYSKDYENMMTAPVTKHPLRIVILGIGDLPDGGATSRRISLLARILGEGFEVVSIWLMHSTLKRKIVANKSSCGRINGIPFIYLSGSYIRPVKRLAALFDTVKGIWGVIWRLINRRVRPDVLVVYTPFFLKFIIPLIVARVLRIPIITECCEIRSCSTDMKNAGFLRKLANVGETKMEWLLPRISSGMIPISTQIQSFYYKLGLSESSSFLLPVLIDYKETHKKKVEGRGEVSALKGVQYVLNSGSFAEKDGVIHLIQAVALVRNLYPKLHLVFTGNVSFVAKDFAFKKAGIADAKNWVIFTGFITQQQLAWCYENSQGLLSCRTNSKYANFGFPTKVAEYLTSTRPVVATKVGDMTNYLTDERSAFLANPEDIHSIADAILRRLYNQEQSIKIGLAGDLVAREYFDYQNYINPLADFVHRCSTQLKLIKQSSI